MKAINERTLHYFVEGGIVRWKSRDRKRLSTWLVYTWIDDAKGQRWVRGLYTAEKGSKGDLAAIYQNRIVSNLELDRICATHVLQFPGNRGTEYIGFDGKPRGIGYEQGNIDSWTLGSCINSVRDETNSCTVRTNCHREWDPEWKTLSSDRTVAKQPVAACMALLLSREVDAYTELLYAYDWNKQESRSLATASGSNPLAQLAGESGIRDTRKRKNSLR
jgi:hypothetical protein